MFTLEALDANNGDCLFLHFGPPDNPGLIIIDGGPQRTGASTFNSAIKPRLQQIAANRAVPLPLPVDLVMVSHIDDDHIGGVLKLIDQANGSANPLVGIAGLWHNSFDDFLNTDDLEAIAAFGRESGPAVAAFDPHTLMAAASVKQGLALRDKAQDLGIVTNAGTGAGFVAAGDSFTIGDLSMQIIGPAKQELQALQVKFDAENPNAATLTEGERLAALADFTDNAIENLSSIVVLAESGGKRILVTGDARGDKILNGLIAAGLMDTGTIDLDILKVPHHGSDHNVSTDFFRKVVARHYVFSADGKNGNPDASTLLMLATAREDAEYTMWFTHRLAHVEAFVAADRAANTRNYSVKFIDDGASSLKIDLDGDLPF